MHTLWQKLRTAVTLLDDLREEKERHMELIGAEYVHVCAWGRGRAAWRSTDLDDDADVPLFHIPDPAPQFIMALAHVP